VCAPDIILEDKEEIVGVFGTKDYKFVENFNAWVYPLETTELMINS
jgi:hypothetical protein